MKLEELNLQNPIGIGYYDPFGNFAHVQREIEAKLPLSNLHWKYHPLKPVKSIPLLPAKLQEEVPATARGDNPQPLGDKIYLRLMVVAPSSLEVYRSQVRPLIQAWLRDLVAHRDGQWAIVFVDPPGRRDKAVLLMKKSVFDKLVEDFAPLGKHLPHLPDLVINTATSNDSVTSVSHIFRVSDTYSSEMEKMEAFNGVASGFKSLILASFSRRYARYHGVLDSMDDAKRLDPEECARELFYQLQLVNILADMRFFDESLDLYNTISGNLRGAFGKLPHAFEKDGGFFSKAKLPESLDLFDPESSILDKEALLGQFSRYLSEGTKIDMAFSDLCLFLSCSILLQSMANFASSISLSASYILHLLQKLMHFVNDVNTAYQRLPLVILWCCALIDFYLRLPLTVKLTLLAQEQATIQVSEGEVPSGVSPVAAISERSGELKLLKRSLMASLAKRQGLTSTGTAFLPSEVPLDESGDDENPPRNSPGNTPRNDNDGDSISPRVETPGNEELPASYKPLHTALLSQQLYEEYYEKLTEEAIADFVSCGRNKTIDLLSIDLALLHYKRKNYRQAFDILLNSYDYFIENGWTFLGGMLLEVYLGCVEHLEISDHLHLVKTSLKLISILKRNRINSCINNFHISGGSSCQAKLFRNVLSTASKLPNSLTLPLDGLLDVEVIPKIVPCAGEEGSFSVDIVIDNAVGLSLDIEEVVLLVEEDGVDEDPFQLKFFRSRVQIVPDVKQQRVKLQSNEFKNSVFVCKELLFKASDHLLFSKKFHVDTAEIGDRTVINHDISEKLGKPDQSAGDEENKTSELQMTKMRMFNDAEKLVGFFRMPRKIELGINAVELVIDNGKTLLSDIDIDIFSVHPGVTIGESDRYVYVDNLPPNEKFTRLIPYTYFGEGKHIRFDGRISYRMGKSEKSEKSEKPENLNAPEKFLYHVSNYVDNNLMISISVQDIFRTDFIYLKFQVGCAQSRYPIRITKSLFECNNGKYHVTSLTCHIDEENTQIVFGEQPCYFFYQIALLAEGVSGSDTLDLTISYSCLQTECEEIIGETIGKTLSEKLLHHYSLLLKELVKEFAFDLNHYAINNVISVTNPAHCIAILNERIIPGAIVSAEEISEINGVFQDIFLQSISGIGKTPPQVSQHLYIPVAVPVLDVLHNVELKFDEKPQYPVGEPIPVNLIIETHTKWKDRSEKLERNEEDTGILASSSPQGKNPSKKNFRGFQYTVHHEDNWLLTGPKKLLFTLDSSQETTKNSFEMALIPLNVGKLQLPRVTVKPVAGTGRDSSADLVHMNGLETVLVVPELHSVTFSF